MSNLASIMQKVAKKSNKDLCKTTGHEKLMMPKSPPGLSEISMREEPIVETDIKDDYPDL